MPATDDDKNVTLAVISNQIENIQDDVTEINGKIDTSNKGINDLNIKTAVIEKGQESFGKEVDALQQKSNRNDVFVFLGNSIEIAVASIATYFGLRD
jgi:peptidoglycan hydrolase CwlO-like protein